MIISADLNLKTVMEDLYDRAEILHRDASNGNFMFRRDPITGKCTGVLNDYDHAVILSEAPSNQTHKTHRTGTLPFLAVDLLGPSYRYHLLRHEIESSFYVLIWHAIIYDDPNHPLSPETSSLKLWCTGDPTVMRLAKVALLQTLSDLDFGKRSQFYQQFGEMSAMLTTGQNAMALASTRKQSMTDIEYETMLGRFYR